MSTIAEIYNTLFAGEKVKVSLPSSKEKNALRVGLLNHKRRQEEMLRRISDEEIEELSLTFKTLNPGVYELSLSEKRKPQEFIILTDLPVEILEILSDVSSE